MTISKSKSQMTIIKASGYFWMTEDRTASVMKLVKQARRRGKVILMLGAGPQITQLERRAGLEPQFDDNGNRLTTAETMPYVLEGMMEAQRIVSTALDNARVSHTTPPTPFMAAQTKGFAGEVTGVRLGALNLDGFEDAICLSSYGPSDEPIKIEMEDGSVEEHDRVALNINADQCAGILGPALSSYAESIDMVFLTPRSTNLEGKAKICEWAASRGTVQAKIMRDIHTRAGTQLIEVYSSQSRAFSLG